MRRYETKTVEVERTNCVKLVCDLCHRIREGTDQWEACCYEVNDTEVQVTVRQKEGKSYPDCGFGDEVVIDICPECFKTKLIPWVESHGTVIERKDWNW
jgi:hypothetical protein